MQLGSPRRHSWFETCLKLNVHISSSGLIYWSLSFLWSPSFYGWLQKSPSEAQICSLPISMIPDDKWNFSLSLYCYYSSPEDLYWHFLFGPNLALISCPHSSAVQVWKKKASVYFDTQKSMCWGDIAENDFWQMFSSLFQSQWQEWIHADTCHFIRVSPDLTSSYWQTCALGNFKSVTTHTFLLHETSWVSAIKTIFFI